MPKLMNQPDTQVQQTVSNFGFSAQRPDTLTGSEYTIVDIKVDTSGSVSGFVADLQKALESVVDSLQKSPHKDSILLRVSTFDTDIEEIHGYIPLLDVDKSLYKLSSKGCTVLFDAALESVESIGQYAKQLDDMDYRVNALSVWITDGDDQGSRAARSPMDVKKGLDKVKNAEKVQDYRQILIGVGDAGRVQGYLDDFTNNAGLSQFVWVGSATPSALAKMAGFISRSVSSSSQALATGGQSKNLTF